MVKNLRRIVMTCVAVCATAAIAFGDSIHPIDIAMPTGIAGGTYQPCVLTVEGQGTAHITSSPSGVVSANVSVVDGENTISVAVASGYTGPVTVYATMEGSSQVVSTNTLVLPD